MKIALVSDTHGVCRKELFAHKLRHSDVCSPWEL